MEIWISLNKLLHYLQVDFWHLYIVAVGLLVGQRSIGSFVTIQHQSLKRSYQGKIYQVSWRYTLRGKRNDTKFSKRCYSIHINPKAKPLIAFNYVVFNEQVSHHFMCQDAILTLLSTLIQTGGPKTANLRVFLTNKNFAFQ